MRHPQPQQDPDPVRTRWRLLTRNGLLGGLLAVLLGTLGQQGGFPEWAVWVLCLLGGAFVVYTCTPSNRRRS